MMNEAVVDEATMNARLEFFVRTVMRHTMQKEKELDRRSWFNRICMGCVK